LIEEDLKTDPNGDILLTISSLGDFFPPVVLGDNEFTQRATVVARLSTQWEHKNSFVVPSNEVSPYADGVLVFPPEVTEGGPFVSKFRYEGTSADEIGSGSAGPPALIYDSQSVGNRVFIGGATTAPFVAGERQLQQRYNTFIAGYRVSDLALDRLAAFQVGTGGFGMFAPTPDGSALIVVSIFRDSFTTTSVSVSAPDMSGIALVKLDLSE
jgi:hypothetical protein